jgi:uncharacterized membrane protein
MPEWFAYVGPAIFVVLITINVYRDRKFTHRINCVKESLESKPQKARSENV